MTLRRLAEKQPETFAFSAENLAWAERETAKYPPERKQSAVIALLWRAQEQSGGWLPEPAMRVVADMLDMAYVRVYEVATFYTMFNLVPVGRYLVQLCGTTPCWLRGADDLKRVCERHIGPKGANSEDGLFTWIEVECLGACVNAPMVQINKDYYEDLDAAGLERILDELKAGGTPKPGSRRGRKSSEPEGGAKTLLDRSIFDSSVAAVPFTLHKKEPEKTGS